MASRNDYSQNRKLYVGTSPEVSVGDDNAIIAGKVGIGTTSPTAPLMIAGSGADGTALLRLEATAGSTNFNWITSNIYPNLQVGKTVLHLFGHAESANNQAHIGFKYAGAGSTSNMFSVGFYANDFLLNVLATGNVGIGTANPLTKLHIAGTTDVSIIRLENTLTALSAGDTIGAIQFFNNDTTDDSPNVAASIYATAGASGGSGSLRFKTKEPGTEGDPATESMIITNAGNVGIGTNVNGPSTPLQVVGIVQINTSTDTAFYEGASVRMFGAQSYSFRNSPGNVRANINVEATGNNAGNLSLFNASNVVTTKLNNAGDSYLNGGNVGIGTTGPTGKLEVQRSQVLNQFDRDCFLRLHPTATTNSSGYTNMFFGTSTTNNYGIAIGGIKTGTGDDPPGGTNPNSPAFSIRVLDDSVIGTEMFKINTTGSVKFNAYGAGTLVTDSAGNITVSSGGGAGGPYLPLAGGTLTGGLNLEYAVTPTIELKDTTNNKTLLIGVDDNNAFIRSGVDEIFLLQVNGGDTAITMLNNSNVGIGTTTPITTLDIGGTPTTGVNIAITAGTSDIGFRAGSGNLDITSANAGVWRQLRAASFIGNVNEDSTFAGNVGIGTTSPDAILETSKEVAGNQVGALLTNTRQAGTADSVSLNFGLGRTADGFIRSVAAVKLEKEQQWTGTPSTVDAALVFSTVQAETVSEKMRIESNGAVGINVTNPQEKLEVDGNIFVTLKFGNLTANSKGVQFEAPTTAMQTCRFDSDALRFFAGGGAGDVLTMVNSTGAATFTNTVTATNFILSSDERLKENIKTLEPKAISAEWKSFNAKDDDSYRTGVIAQELEIEHPEFVETNEEGFKSVKYIDLLISKIAELEHRIKQLEK
jgi:hypothetical protein